MVLRHVSTTERHAPHPGCLKTHCYSHGVDELETPFTYRVCGECFHVYETSHDLVKAWQAAVDRLEPMEDTPAADDIHFCQFCTHDF
jgi:hypothetical protein